MDAFSSINVFCQFNSQAAFTKHEGLEEKFFFFLYVYFRDI